MEAALLSEWNSLELLCHLGKWPALIRQWSIFPWQDLESIEFETDTNSGCLWLPGISVSTLFLSTFSCLFTFVVYQEIAQSWICLSHLTPLSQCWVHCSLSVFSYKQWHLLFSNTSSHGSAGQPLPLDTCTHVLTQTCMATPVPDLHISTRSVSVGGSHGFAFSSLEWG